MTYSEPKEILEWIRSHLTQELSDFTYEIDDDWKQWRLTVGTEKVPEDTAIWEESKDGKNRNLVCVLTIGLHEVRLVSYVWNGRDREFPMADPSLLTQLTQHIKFCQAISS
jgi:hypothetical protein